MDTQKLIKILNLTNSPVDGEALSAARFANQLLNNEGLTWENLLNNPKQDIPKKEFEGPKRDMSWRVSKNGNYCKKKGDAWVTVFESKKYAGSIHGFTKVYSVLARLFMKKTPLKTSTVIIDNESLA